MTGNPPLVRSFSTASVVYGDGEDSLEMNARTPDHRRAQLQEAAAVTVMRRDPPEAQSDQTLGLTLQLVHAQNQIGVLQEQVKEMDRLREIIAALSLQPENTTLGSPRALGSPTVGTGPQATRVRHISSFSTVPSLVADTATSIVAATPTTPVTPRSTRPPSSGSTSVHTSRRRHVRTKTPEQHATRELMNGRKLYTLGMERQDDRGLIADFFDEIKNWATIWTVDTGDLSDQSLAAFINIPAVQGFFKHNQHVRPVVSDRVLRVDLVAAIVARDIVSNTMCDHFLHNSGHPEAAACDELFNKFIQLSPAQIEQKNDILVQQNALYTQIQDQRTYRSWRDEVGEAKTAALLKKLGPLVSKDAADGGHEALLAHYIKGYRIGFRMRMDAKKWTMSWPNDGEDFNPRVMVNESRFLYGSIIDTMNKTRDYPENFTVRFARSPYMTKTDFFYGYEDKNPVHSALVQLKEKPAFVGAEAERRRMRPQPTTTSTSSMVYM